MEWKRRCRCLLVAYLGPVPIPNPGRGKDSCSDEEGVTSLPAALPPPLLPVGRLTRSVLCAAQRTAEGLG